MCTGQSFYFSGCGHSQSQYTRLCPLSKDKTQTSCDRLEYGGAQSGICAACRSLDARIEQLKVEIRDRERELADAMGARGIPVQAYGDVIAVDDRNALGMRQSMFEEPRNRVAFAHTVRSMLSGHDAGGRSINMTPAQTRSFSMPNATTGTSLCGTGSEGSHDANPPWMASSSRDSVQSMESARNVLYFRNVLTSPARNSEMTGKENLGKMIDKKKMQSEIADIANTWWSEREGYQVTLSKFQNKGLGAISYRDRIQKCNNARDQLVRSVFEDAEKMIVKQYD